MSNFNVTEEQLIDAHATAAGIIRASFRARGLLAEADEQELTRLLHWHCNVMIGAVREATAEPADHGIDAAAVFRDLGV